MDTLKEGGILTSIGELWSGDEISLSMLVINLIIGFILSLFVKIHYRMFSSVLTNKSTIARVLPFIVLTTILIISIVKSSLALSLGLVGALSIVRFRTPIKEPEELAYLFISIAIGLGLGANQTLNTVIAAIIILLMMAYVKRRDDSKDSNKDYYLSIDAQKDNVSLSGISEIVSKYTNASDMRRYQISDDFSNIVFFIDITDVDQLNSMSQELREKYDGIEVSFIDQSNMPLI
ncbi:MAG: DUF4956 domain-containing protein [Acidiferrobacteraceae bacterium]|nr:DUF4956 domain-containing protein [Acidiferrobacteraceae bacterium]